MHKIVQQRKNRKYGLNREPKQHQATVRAVVERSLKVCFDTGKIAKPEYHGMVKDRGAERIQPSIHSAQRSDALAVVILTLKDIRLYDKTQSISPIYFVGGFRKVFD